MMASHAPTFGRASALPLSAVLASIPSYPRPVIERLVARLIDRLDGEDGDPDTERNGDELDGTNADDEEGNKTFCYLPGAGCPFSDPGEDEHDAEDDRDGRDGLAAYGIDQRIAAVGHGYAPWHIDRETPA